MHKALKLSVFGAFAFGACAFVPLTTLRAQNADSLTTARAEDVLIRVRRLTANDVAAARALIDSLVVTLPASATVMPEALFAKASIAPSAVEAERDYGRIVKDFKFSGRVPDALMRLALLESARNNRVMALRHLEQLLRDHSDAAVRSRASLLAGRLRLDAGDLARACELLAAAYASAGLTERDVKEQAESLGAQCPTPVAMMAQREPPPLGIARAARVAPAPIAAATTVPATRRNRRDSSAVVKPTATVVRRDSAPAAKPVVPVVLRDTVPASVAPVVRRDTASMPKPVPPVVRRDTAPAPKPVTPVVRRDTAPTPKPVPPVVRRDTAPAPKPVPPVVPRDTAPTPKPVPPVVRRETAPTPKPVPPVVRRDTAPTPKPAPSAVRTDSAITPAPAGRFGVQFAAYNDRPGAEQFASALRGKGITARVEGTVAPFRVRAGRFATRAEAEASAALWRRPGQPAIVVELGPRP